MNKTFLATAFIFALGFLTVALNGTQKDFNKITFTPEEREVGTQETFISAHFDNYLVKQADGLEETVIQRSSSLSDYHHTADGFGEAEAKEYLVVEKVTDGSGPIEPPETRKPSSYSICEQSCKQYLTIVANQGARFGHYFSTWKASYIIAHMMNLTLVHHDFTPKNGITAQQWEKFLGIGEGLEDYASFCVDQEMISGSFRKYLKKECVKYLHCVEAAHLPFFEAYHKDKVRKYFETLKATHQNSCHTIFVLQFDQTVHFDLVPEEGMDFGNYIQNSYQKARLRNPIRLYFEADVFNVAIHIRRGDVKEKKGEKNERFIPNESYFILISRLKILLEAKDYQKVTGKKAMMFHIYSEGNPDDFGELQSLSNLTFHLNDDEFSTLHHLASAEILVGGYSGFSQFCRIIAKGIPLFPFIRSNLGVKITPSGSLDEEAFHHWWNKYYAK